jgi:hypothetical protein
MKPNSSEPRTSHGKKLFKAMAWGLVWVFTLIALMYAVENWRGNRAWSRVRQDLASRGIPWEYQELAPSPVPDSENFGALPIVTNWFKEGNQSTQTDFADRLNEAQNLVKKPRVDRKLPQPRVRTDLVALAAAFEALNRKSDNFIEIPGTKPEEDSPSARRGAGLQIIEKLAKSRDTLDQVRVGLERPYARYPINYSTPMPFGIKLNHLRNLREYAQRFQILASAELCAGQPEAAVADVETLIDLSNTVKSEPILISQLVRIAILNLAIQPVWEGLQAKAWREPELARLQTAFAELDLFPDLNKSWIGERACALSTLDYCRQQGNLNTVMNANDPTGTPNPSGAAITRMLPNGWYLLEMANYSRTMDRFLHAVDFDHRRIYPEKLTEENEVFKPVDTFGDRFGILWRHELMGRLLMPALGKALHRFAATQATIDQARLACRLEAFRLKNGTYPPSLDRLEGAKLPSDLLTGQSYAYKPDAEGFKLYSFGWDGDDDQGTPVPPVNTDQSGDWVWGYMLR